MMLTAGHLNRRIFLAALTSGLALPGSARAQNRAVLHPERLEALIKEALKSEQGRFARPEALGLSGENVFYKGVSSVKPDAQHYINVVVPEIADGLIFFRGKEKPMWWAMHRTGRHLRRMVSARNIDGKLTTWTGAAPDRDFQSQLAFWAKSD